MHRFVVLATALFVTSVSGCGPGSDLPNLGAIATYGGLQGNWEVSPDDTFTCQHYVFELENNDDRSYHFTRMAPVDTVVQLSEGSYAAPYFWGWMEAVEEFGTSYLILEPEERQDPMFQLCVDAAPLFGRQVVSGGEGFCLAQYDPVTGDYTGVTGTRMMNFEGILTMEGFDEYGNEFGPRGPTPQYLGGTIKCVP